MNFDKTKKALREIHSEPGTNGTLSWGRVAASAALLSGIVWVTRLVFHTHALPDLTGVTTFAVAPYAANKAMTAAQSFSSNPVTPQVVPPSTNS